MLQQVLLPTRSDSRASTRYSRHPYTTRHGPPWWSMQPAQHMCMRTMLPLSNTHWSTRAVLSLSLALGHACCDPSLSHMQLGSLSHWGSLLLSRIGARALCSLSLAFGHTWCDPSLLHATRVPLTLGYTRCVLSLLHAARRVGGCMGCSSRRRCGAQQQQEEARVSKI
jgi:hypothetical protein